MNKYERFLKIKAKEQQRKGKKVFNMFSEREKRYIEKLEEERIKRWAEA